MTGFARGETATPQGQLLWEARSINHRYLEVQLKLPDFCRAIETDLRQLATIPGVVGAIVGRALYSGAVDLRRALAEVG